MYGIFHIRSLSVGLDSQIWYPFIYITGYLNVRKISKTMDFRTFVGPLVKMINFINVQLLDIEPGNQQIPQNNLQATSLQLFASTYLFNYHMYQNSLRAKFCFYNQTVFSNLELRPYISAVRKSVISPGKCQITLQFLINLTLVR